jgi:hypothetical protein
MKNKINESAYHFANLDHKNKVCTRMSRVALRFLFENGMIQEEDRIVAFEDIIFPLMERLYNEFKNSSLEMEMFTYVDDGGNGSELVNSIAQVVVEEDLSDLDYAKNVIKPYVDDLLNQMNGLKPAQNQLTESRINLDNNKKDRIINNIAKAMMQDFIPVIDDYLEMSDEISQDLWGQIIYGQAHDTYESVISQLSDFIESRGGILDESSKSLYESYVLPQIDPNDEGLEHLSKMIANYMIGKGMIPREEAPTAAEDVIQPKVVLFMQDLSNKFSKMNGIEKPSFKNENNIMEQSVFGIIDSIFGNPYGNKKEPHGSYSQDLVNFITEFALFDYEGHDFDLEDIKTYFSKYPTQKVNFAESIVRRMHSLDWSGRKNNPMAMRQLEGMNGAQRMSLINYIF